MSCEVCHGPLTGDSEDYDRWTDCDPCENVIRRYKRLSGTDGDADYALHELAHHVLLFRCLPRSKSDWGSIEWTIAMFPLGKAQVHELRTLALQHVTYEMLGWKPSLERLVGLSWPGLRDIDDMVNDPARGRSVVSTERDACAYVRRILPKVSPRNVRLYATTIRSWRGEVVSQA